MMSDKSKIAQGLLEATKDGPATQWNDRMAEVARDAGLPLHDINWIGSPSCVAFNVARHACNYGGPQKDYFVEKFAGECSKELNVDEMRKAGAL
jgi:hypothetical protein